MGTTDESLVSFRAYVETIFAERDRQYAQRFDAQEKAVASALAAAEKAVTKAEIATEKRFDSVNEFRAVLANQQEYFARKSEVELRFTALDAKVDDALRSRDQGAGKSAGVNAMWGYFVGAAAAGAALSVIVGKFL